MITDISKEKKKVYKITKPGTQVFFLGARSGDITFSLEKPGAEVHVFGLIEGKDKNKADLSITQHHKAPRTASHVLVKSVMRGSAALSFEGVIHIDKNAQRSEAHLTNRNLLLSKDARVESKPILEILPDDVVCTHAAATGRVDDEQLHFLQLRGCTKKDAEALLVEGFTEDVHSQMHAVAQN